MAKSDVEVLVDEGDLVELSSGTKVILQPLKSRQFFKLLRIITHGAGSMLLNVRFSGDDTPEEFSAKLLALVGFAIPDAEDEVIDFLFAMIKPVGLKEGRKLSASDRADNKQLEEDLAVELDNPELEDLITLVEAIVKRESSDLQALGKRVMAMFDLAKKTGQLPEQIQTENEKTSDE
jgi:hypothetical protein